MLLLSAPARHASLALALAASATRAIGAEPPADLRFAPGSAVAVVVKVPKPWYVPAPLIVGRMRDTMPQYAALPGLAYKAYSLAQADGQFGGLYLWKDEATARGFFDRRWFERVERERGVRAQVRFYEVPVAIDNTAGRAVDDGAAVGTLVTVKTPPATPRARLVEAFEAAIPVYRQVPGLLRKHFIITDDGHFGGIYVWKDGASARQWFDAAWHDRALKTYGAPAAIEWFDTPILLPSTLSDNTPSVPGLSPRAAS